jgi:hypothetical protein
MSLPEYGKDRKMSASVEEEYLILEYKTDWLKNVSTKGI